MNVIGNATVWIADRGGVPIWILGKNGELIYSSVKKTYIADPLKRRKFFSIFLSESSETPQVKKVFGNELYANFSFEAQGERYVAVVGPAYEVHPLSGGKRGTGAVLFREETIRETLLMMPVMVASEFCRYTEALYETVAHRVCDAEQLESNIRNYDLHDLLDEQLAEWIFDIREEEQETAYAPDAEKKLFSYVTSGDVEALRNFRMPRIKDRNAMGNRYQSLFEAVAIVTLATRAAIAGGLDYVVAFSLSDLYLKRLSHVSGETEIAGVVAQVLPHFAQKVRESLAPEKKRIESPYILKSIRYIRSHLHSRILLEDVAHEVGLEAKYFSRLFVTATGEKFSAFVQRERIEEARNLLESTNRTIIDISNSLGFSSQSYFIKVFTRYMGETPGEYLEKNKRGKYT